MIKDFMKSKTRERERESERDTASWHLEKSLNHHTVLPACTNNVSNVKKDHCHWLYFSWQKGQTVHKLLFLTPWETSAIVKKQRKGGTAPRDCTIMQAI